MYYTYVLICKNVDSEKEVFYVGSTKDLKERIIQHKAGHTKTTKQFDTIKLVYYEACIDKTDSIKREKQLKTGFGRGYIRKRISNYLFKRV